MAGGLQLLALDAIVVIEGGAPGLLSYLESVSWEPPRAPAFLVAREHLGESGVMYYVFGGAEFQRRSADVAALPPSERTTEVVQELFVIHEWGVSATVPPGEEPADPAVVLGPTGVEGVWAEVDEVAYAAPPSGDEELSWAVDATGGGFESMPAAPPPAAPAEPLPMSPPPPPPPPPAPAASPPYTGETASGGERRAGPTASSPGSPGLPRTDEPEPAPEPDLSEVSRDPHLDLSDEAPAPGATFTVTVYADASGSREGEQTSGIITLVAPAGVLEFPLRVWLTTTSELEVEEPNDLPLVIHRDQPRSTEAVFRVRVSPQAKPGATASVTAVFVYEGRPCGHVKRNVGIGTVPAVLSPVVDGAAQAALRIDTTAKPPDLTIEVLCPENDMQRFTCRVTTPLLPGGTEQSPAPWNLPGVSSTIVGKFMEGFTRKGISDAQRRANLVGAGKLLFNAAPENFKNTFWALVDAGTLPTNIYIVSQEPSIPWELMMPNRLKPDGTREERPPLGVEFAVGRWVNDVPLSPKQQLKLAEAWVVAPTYKGSQALKQSSAETQMLKELFGARQVNPALFDSLSATFRSPGMSLLHFICHGVASGSGDQTLKLDPEESLTSTDLLGMPGAAGFQTSQPMVFLNACEVGRPEPALVGTGGFAKAFIFLGARCVIAPLWSVKDSIAHEVATTFYQRMSQEPGVPLANILRDIRKKAYEETGGEDTYAAYTFYGDPLAAQAPAS